MKPFPNQAQTAVRSLAQELTAEAERLECAGKSVVRLLLGQPSTGAPAGAIAKMYEFSKRDPFGYTNALGTYPLREKIAGLYQRRHGITISPDQIGVTVGASMALIVILLTCFKHGAKIAIPYPAYPGQKNTLDVMGYKSVGIYTARENNFQLTLADLENLAEPIDGLVVSSPSNPTGAMIEERELARIMAYCKAKNITFISDEIYHGIVYPDSPHAETALKFDPDALIINSFSKYFSMPGWRVGWVVAPKELICTMGNVLRNLYLSTPAPSQYVALGAFEYLDLLDEYIHRYMENRELMRQGLERAGFKDYIEPQGAFYFYVNIAHTGKRAEQFCWDLLHEQGVAIMPGEPFDPLRGHEWIRLSYASSREMIEEAMRRLLSYV